MKKFRDIVEKHFKIDIGVKSRDHDRVFARACYFKLCRVVGGYSYQKIAKSLGLNHATVLHGLKKALPAMMSFDNNKKALHDSLIIQFEKFRKIEKEKLTLDQLVIKYNNELIKNGKLEKENKELKEIIYQLADTD